MMPSARLAPRSCKRLQIKVQRLPVAMMPQLLRGPGRMCGLGVKRIARSQERSITLLDTQSSLRSETTSIDVHAWAAGGKKRQRSREDGARTKGETSKAERWRPAPQRSLQSAVETQLKPSCVCRCETDGATTGPDQLVSLQT